MKRMSKILMMAVLTISACLMSCGETIIIGSIDTPAPKPEPAPEEMTEEEAEKQLIAEVVALIEEAQQEGSVTTLSLTLDGVEYPFTFKMVTGQFVLQTAAGTRGNVNEALAKFDIAVATLARAEADEKQVEEEDNFAADPEYDNDDNLFDGSSIEDEVDWIVGDDNWTDEDEAAYEEWLRKKAGSDDGISYKSKDDAAKAEDIANSTAEHAADDDPDVSYPGTDKNDPILDVTVKDKSTGETVLAAQYDPATYSLTQTGEKGNSCSPTVVINKTTKDVSPKTPTCSITYPNGKVKYMYFKSGKYQNWGELLTRYNNFGKISKSKYIFYDNYWLCETDGKTIVTAASEIEASYKFCRKVNNIGLEFVNNKPHNLSVGDTFKVKIKTSPADALLTGVFGLYENDGASIALVDDDYVFEISCLKAGKFKLKFFYQDYGKKFTKELKIKIQEAEQPQPDPDPTPDPDPAPTPTVEAGSISFTETEHSVTWSATASANTYTQTVTKTGDGPVTYSINSDNTCGATINASTGVVTFTKAGSVKVTAKVENTDTYVYETKEVSYYLTVNKADAAISFKDASVTKTYGDAAFTNTLNNTGDGSVIYSSDKTSVATVNATSGEVEIIGVGTATITATVKDSDNCHYAKNTASYKITVTAAPVPDPTINPRDNYENDGDPLASE